jgi:hypothetical protein
VLKAYACYRADVGYVQGMSYIVSMLLLYMDELQAFQSLANLLCRRGNMDFYRLKKFAIDAYVMCFDFFFKQHLPLLYVHMKSEGVTSEMYLMDWNLSLFAKVRILKASQQQRSYCVDCRLCRWKLPLGCGMFTSLKAKFSFVELP